MKYGLLGHAIEIFGTRIMLKKGFTCKKFWMRSLAFSSIPLRIDEYSKGIDENAKDLKSIVLKYVCASHVSSLLFPFLVPLCCSRFQIFLSELISPNVRGLLSL